MSTHLAPLFCCCPSRHKDWAAGGGMLCAPQKCEAARTAPRVSGPVTKPQGTNMKVGLLNGSRTRLHNFKPSSASGLENLSALPQDVELAQPQPVTLQRGWVQTGPGSGARRPTALVRKERWVRSFQLQRVVTWVGWGRWEGAEPGFLRFTLNLSCGPNACWWPAACGPYFHCVQQQKGKKPWVSY